MSIITSSARLLLLFESVVNKFTLDYVDIFSASSKRTVHLAGVKSGFLARFAEEGTTFSSMLSYH